MPSQHGAFIDGNRRSVDRRKADRMQTSRLLFDAWCVRLNKGSRPIEVYSASRIEDIWIGWQACFESL